MNVVSCPLLYNYSCSSDRELCPSGFSHYVLYYKNIQLFANLRKKFRDMSPLSPCATMTSCIYPVRSSKRAWMGIIISESFIALQ